jgi:hypothetical protein
VRADPENDLPEHFIFKKIPFSVNHSIHKNPWLTGKLPGNDVNSASFRINYMNFIAHADLREQPLGAKIGMGRCAAFGYPYASS